ncbi:MAG: aminotransferase class V-fold PLP-dependent enzyme [Chloroflexi bacterium]|nr:MAG: aminotransferase class V-fold PLP-dependent enzyme [Chloroflexota bacterium]
MYDLAALREAEFPITRDYVYLNYASIAPLPECTRRKMAWALSRLAEQPINFWIDEANEMRAYFRKVVADFLNARSADEVVPVPTTATGINLVAQAIPWQVGDNVVFCEVEFPANAYPWLNLRRDGVEVRLATAVSGGLSLATLEPFIDHHTRVLAVSALQFFSGHRTDLATLGQFCREHNILFVVDAIQAIGHIPIDVQAMQIDVLATGGQKSLMAAPGNGFLYVRQEVAAGLHSRFIAANAVRDYEHWLHYDLTPLPGAQRFTLGTPNLSGMYGIIESIKLIEKLGRAAIDQHTSQLTAEIGRLLQQAGYDIITPLQPGKYGPILTFRTNQTPKETDALVQALREHKISVVKHLNAAGEPHIRISFHCYNTMEDVARFMHVWRKLAPSTSGRQK